MNISDFARDYLVEEPQQIGSGFRFTEGPLWNRRGGYLDFSDIVGDVRRRWDADAGVRETHRPNNKGNGMVYDAQGGLLICEHATSSVVREFDGDRVTLASHFDGHELNSPNDLVVAGDGSIIFTDPTFGRMPDYGVERPQELAMQGVYRIGTNGEISLLVDDFEQPNGLCFEPGEGRLYINDTAKCEVRVFDVDQETGALRNGSVFADGIGPDDDRPGAPDGMKCDVDGNVLVTGPGGVWVFDPSGNRLGVIALAEMVANLNWGGDDSSELFFTASTSLYRATTTTSGAAVPGDSAALS